MHKQIFVNLPIKDLKRTMDFFAALGFSFNPQFTNDAAACMVVGENIFVMLLTEPFFQGFIKKQIADAHTTTETLIALSCESRAAVDDIVGKGLAAGGTEPRDPQDHGFMYIRSLEDLDGHIWEYCWMDPNAQPHG